MNFSSLCRNFLFDGFTARVVFVMHLFFLSVVSSTIVAQQIPSNVYRPPADNFVPNGQAIPSNQPSNQIIQGYRQGQTYQAVPQSQPTPQYQQTIPNYPLQTQPPVYQQPFQQAPVQVAPERSKIPPRGSFAESNELKRSLVRARDLLEKYQVKLEDATRSNEELQNEIADLKRPMEGSGVSKDSQELLDARAAANETKRQASGLNAQLQQAVQNLQTSTGELDRQKQIAIELEQQVVSLRKAFAMAAGNEDQVAELTKALDSTKSQNEQLSGKLATLENVVREKEMQISRMGSDDNSQLADLRELLKESEAQNKDIAAKLKLAEAKSDEFSAMTSSEADPALDQLRADNQQLDQQKQQLETRLSQLEEQNGKLDSQNVSLENQFAQLNNTINSLTSNNRELETTVTRLSSMAKPATEPAGFAASTSAVTPVPDVSGLQNRLAAAARENQRLTRQLQLSKSKYASLSQENSQDSDSAGTDTPEEIATTPVLVTSDILDAAPAAVAAPDLALNSLSSVSARWPVKYWIFGMLGIGLVVGLGVAWYESVVDPKSKQAASR